MTTALPTGTVTFLFTDIEGSTRLVALVGDAAYGALLDTERDLVLGAARGEGGVPFGSEGDAHFVAFGSAAAAVRAAVAAQRALASHPWPGAPLRVRMGIHSGEAQVVGGDYVGFEVHRAARVAAAGHGGQVLVSEPSRALAGEPGDGVAFRDLGEHRLKDLALPERLYQVAADGLEPAFPPLKTLDVAPNNLPPQLTSFVGRAEVDRALELLSRSRLLTLTGPGGTGKTRLSLALAGDCVERFPGGTWFVPLAAVTDPDLVASSIASSIGLLSPTRAPIDRVRDYFHDRTALLVLDNFEQVVAGAPVVADLLRSAPGLTAIVSSRAPLRIAGEQEFPVPPLSLPPVDATDLETLMDAEAVRLFVERAMAVRPDFVLTADNGRAVGEIVRRLDGLPLAIELAAARIRLLSPAAMAQRLGDRLGLLSAGGRDLPERQRTLRGAIDWSHDLLEPEERLVFARIGVFAGGAELDMAERVCGPADGGGGLDVVGSIERLAEQSLVRVGEDVHGDVRLQMLETIREYALERLEASGEAAAMRERHAHAFLELVRGEGARASGTDEARGGWFDRLDDDHDNLRAALDWFIAEGQADRAADLVHGVWRFWQQRGHLVEGRRRADEVLAMPGATTPGSKARLRALEAAGGLAYWAADMGAAARHYAAAVDEARATGDEAEVANALYNQSFAQNLEGSPATWLADLVAADQPMLEEALEIWTRLGDDSGRARALWAIGEHHIYRGELSEGEASTSEALAIFERLGDAFWVAWSRFTRSYGRAVAGDVHGAAADLHVALAGFLKADDVSGVVLIEAGLAGLLLQAGRTADAYRVAAATQRRMSQTGIYLASLSSSDLFEMPDFETADPELRLALEEGAAWSAEEAGDRAAALLSDLVATTPPAPDRT